MHESSLSGKIAKAVVEAIYVPMCATCDRRGRWVCDECSAKLSPISSLRCHRCGVIGRRTCECANLPPEINRLISVYPFNGWIRDAIHRLKFEGERARAPMLASQVAHVENELRDSDGIVPVPIHPRRMAVRGFNQSELLAIQISENYGIPMVRALERIEDRGSQVGRNSPDRWKAVEGVFACTNVKQVRNRRLIVLDDVITTGATVSSCAQELIRCGAAEVRGLSIARG